MTFKDFQTFKTAPIDGQKPGTSGLRKKVAVFSEPGYLETYTQAIFNAIEPAGKTFVLGGDGRFFNGEAIVTILRMAAANGVAKIILGQNGILSTPAVSHLIRKRGADGGFILSASHNPGGPNGDFGLKYNTANGGPAPEAITDEIVACAEAISEYKIGGDLSEVLPTLGDLGSYMFSGMEIEIIDPVEDYAALMEELFDFDAIRTMIDGGFTLRFDAMHAVTGPYAVEILERRLGATKGSVVNAVPLVDFGGGHPDPNPVWAKELFDHMHGPEAPDFGAASDGDGDRNMIVGKDIYVAPSDSLAVLAANAHLAPGYARGIAGVARSMPTSTASDRVAEKMGIEAFQTPTGWKFFSNLLDAGRATLCGEESAGTGSDHVREKDGLWAVLLWLNILAVRGESVADILMDHWQTYGRDYYSRHDYEALDTESANHLMTELKSKLTALPGLTAAGMTVKNAEDFAYTDPIDGSVATGQGIILTYEGGARAMLRLSGTGTEGATLRVYLEQYANTSEPLSRNVQEALSDVIAATSAVAGIQGILKRTEPDVIS
ncbi:alpha-D-glucose phosphate-specific phosphoglucomutase [Aliiroseovarius sp. S253]|uniref:alpha-D-glucose phosphate-specific phosphoglucomutase n=1 Tax=Aliiroseovarius sp. S253 TaxID=3415133 RepID=UPI003C7C4492